MNLFFRPKGIALIGASANPKKGGNAILVNVKAGYKGGIYPVNPRYQEIDGTRCYPSVAEVPDPVELAVIFIPGQRVPDAIEQCGQRGIRRVIIESGGFAESGKAGRELQETVAGIARRYGIRLWGPNCMGIVDGVNQHVFSFVSPTLWEEGLLPGNVSLVVQSGMLSGGFLIDIMGQGVMGVSKVCSIGNKMDVDECDLLEYLVQDNDTGAVGLYLEGIDDGRRFMQICRRSPKPVVVLKGGRSIGGAAAAMSHTASMAGNGAVVSGALAQAGAVEAHDFKQLMDICRTLARFPDAEKRTAGRVAVLTFSGGAGIVSADFLDETGLELATLSQPALDTMRPVFPDWMPISNPVDLWPAVEQHGVDRTFGTALRAVCNDPGVDAVLIHTFIGGFALDPDIDALAQVASSAGKPLLVWMLGRREEARRFQIRAQGLGVPVFGELYRAIECMHAMFQNSRRRLSIKLPPEAPPGVRFPESLGRRIAGCRGVVDEHRAKEILHDCGLPVVAEEIAGSVEDACRIGRALGFPVVMKGLVPGEIHKTEHGNVRLGLANTESVAAAFVALKTALPATGRVLVQRQVKGDLELIAGLTRDPQFGLCVMLGLGGVMAEILDDSVFAVAPLTRSDALGMVSRLKNQRLLDGFRGIPAVDREVLADILVRLGALGLAWPQVGEVDINPMIVCDGRPVAVDATIVMTGESALT